MAYTYFFIEVLALDKTESFFYLHLSCKCLLQKMIYLIVTFSYLRKN